MAQLLVSRKFPQLFHYTSVEAFEGIFRTRQFWATHYGDMNDASEHRRFFLIAKNFIRPLVAKKFEERMQRAPEFASAVAASGGIAAVIDQESDMHIRQLHESIFGQLEGPFLVSFCYHDPSTHEASNGLLSQWRGYGAGGGVAIVLSTSGMETLMREEASAYAHTLNHLGDAKYDNDEQGIHNDFKIFFDLAPTIVDTFYNRMQPPYEDIFSAYVRGTTLVKHHGFHEERELRLVVCPRSTDPNSVFYNSEHDGKPTKPVRYRQKGHGEARYVELFGPQSLPIERVIIGPSRIQNVNRQRVNDIISGTEIQVTISDIPFVG